MKNKNKESANEKSHDHVEEMKIFVERKNAENKVLKKILDKINTTPAVKNKKK